MNSTSIKKHLPRESYLNSQIVLCYALAFCVLFVAPNSRLHAEKDEILPNFLVIMVDDLGAKDLGCYGGTYIRTPHIDHLAKEGVIASRAYAAAAICSPTRAAWITGRHPARLGITDWIRSRFQRPPHTLIDIPRFQFDQNPNQAYQTPTNPFYLPLSEITVAEIVRQRGYKTAHIGKWHLGDDQWYPEHQGYDVNIGGCDLGQPPTYFDPFQNPNANNDSSRMGITGLPGRAKGEFLTDREVDEAISLIKAWKGSPFYIQLNHYAVHTPIEAPGELTEVYLSNGKSLQQAKYAALLETVDRGLGRLRSTIQSLAMKRPTIIVFTSDNGGLDQNGAPTDNAPLRDGKGTPYEGGLRIPLILYGDGLFTKGATLDVPTCSMDWLPTLCELINIGNPENVELDGVSLVSALRQPVALPNITCSTNRRFVWHFPHYRGGTLPYSVLQISGWKLIFHYGAPAELYYLPDDPFEERNVAEKNGKRLEDMKSILFEELNRLGASIPKKQ
jgi:arylsulfatase A